MLNGLFLTNRAEGEGTSFVNVRKDVPGDKYELRDFLSREKQAFCFGFSRL